LEARSGEAAANKLTSFDLPSGGRSAPSSTVMAEIELLIAKDRKTYWKANKRYAAVIDAEGESLGKV